MAHCGEQEVKVQDVGLSETVGNGLVLREYQKQLAELGVRQNIIVCLPTGSGKTLVAVSVMNSPELRHEVMSEGKKIVFVINTVHLGVQQADYIQKHTSYKVLLCTSDSTKAKSWTSQRWKQEIEAHQVLVMIAQLCFDKLLQAILNFQEMALLVLDECHNATKLHKMNEVMKQYHKYVEANVGAHTPRIIGLTATINKTTIAGDITEGRIALEVKALEDQLAAKAVSFEDMEEVKRFSTASTVRAKSYSPDTKHEWEGLLDGMKRLHSFIMTQRRRRNDLSDIERLALTMRLPNFSRASTFTSKSDDVKNELNKLILDFEEMYYNIGPLGCAEGVNNKMEYLLQYQNKLAGHKQSDYEHYDLLNVRAVITQLLYFHAEVNQRLKPLSAGMLNVITLKNFLSYKMETLLGILKDYSKKEGSDDQLLGLVFVKRRSYATAVKNILEIMAKADPTSYGFIKPELITGTNNTKRDAKEARVSMANQKKILDSFRSGHVNLIICTTVLEEGIDVPFCNLVVRFDEVHAYTSFIQSMGRARKAGAQFFVLMSSAEKAKAEKKLQTFIKQNKMMDNILQMQKDNNQSYLQYELLDDEPELEDIDDFAPYGSGPKIVASSAVALVYRYIQKDPTKKILSWYNIETPSVNKPEHKFAASVLIVEDPVFPGVVKGPLMSSPQDAKKAAFMEVCRVLFAAKALDENLLPV